MTKDERIEQLVNLFAPIIPAEEIGVVGFTERELKRYFELHPQALEVYQSVLHSKRMAMEEGKLYAGPTFEQELRQKGQYDAHLIELLEDGKRVLLRDLASIVVEVCD